MLTTLAMEKPKGGRGHVAPYETKQMRVPTGLESQIQELVSRYRNWISQAGYSAGIGTGNPPNLLDKAVDNFNELVEVKAELEALKEENAQLRSHLEKAQAEAKSCHEQIDRLKTATPNLEVARARYLASLPLGKQAPEYKRTKSVLDRFIAALQHWS